jgi:hypothetical protein
MVRDLYPKNTSSKLGAEMGHSFIYINFSKSLLCVQCAEVGWGGNRDDTRA